MGSKYDRGLGLVLVGIGVLISLERFQLLEVRHWWTLLIIVPSFLDMLKRQVNRTNAIWLGLGISLFATAQFTFLSGMMWPIMLVIIGGVLIFIPKF